MGRTRRDVRSSGGAHQQAKELHVDEWIGPKEIAALLAISTRSINRSFETVETANQKWGEGNWRRKPLSERKEMQVRATRVRKMAADAIGNLGDDEGPSPS
jgi:hypothetical protein